MPEFPDFRVTSDSKQVEAGSVFVAIRGVSRDGHDFIPEARARGASLIVAEEGSKFGADPSATNLGPEATAETILSHTGLVCVPNTRRALAQLAAHVYGNPSHSMKVIGVTGTSGKTTTTYLIESILRSAGHRVGVIGTVSFRYGEKVYPSTHTTPDALDLQRLLSEMKADGCTAVVMEVSSHALRQDRAAFVAFDAVAFTNLSPEHQDFHPDMEHYFQSKKILFTDCLEYSKTTGKRPVAVVNIDDPYGRRLFEELRSETSEMTPAPTRSALLSFQFSDLKWSIDLNGIAARAGDTALRSTLTGRFNALNILTAVTIARGLEITTAEISAGVAALTVVPGRLEKVQNSKGIHVFVDYAHKPDALEKVLFTLNEALKSRASERTASRLITVFGCGGDRDRKKRPVMGRLAVEHSDIVVITSDNPRRESPDAIIQEILAGIDGSGFDNYKVEADRQKAIQLAIADARPGDVVLIAGKGHEDYQIIADPSSPSGTRKIHFDDREIAAHALK